MTNQILPLIGLVLILLVSGCTSAEQTPEVETPIDDIQTTDPDPVETPEPIPDPTPEPKEPAITPPVIVEPVEKFEAPYSCGDHILLENFRELFGDNTEILRKPPAFGKPMSFSTCNVRLDGTVLVQLEFHENITLTAALESMEDEARQIESQLLESVKQTESIGEKGYSFSSDRTREYRFVYVDSDPELAVFVLVRSLPGSDVQLSLVKQAAVTIEKII